ncbi:hypothetical protein EPUL_004255 [Erysiphe pulchra]|uniref:Integrase catalytic domain-containing protein n=1 Tax=Erysiphe pulchra TaxID=225359 RepID=A0A2S4PLK3_9PEZI|nr:hypothetical protein EPUL_004255 [Erysiphe pulchra]
MISQNLDEALEAVVQFANVYENNSNNKRIRIFATDNGTEHVNKRFKTLLDKKGIIHQLAPAYTKEPNGIIERLNRTITNKIRCLLKNADLLMYLWGEACLTATFLHNRTPHSSIDFKTPYEAKYNRKPDITNIKTFGSICYYKNKGNLVRKLDDKAIKGVLVGFNDALYKVYNFDIKKCIWTTEVVQDDTKVIPMSQSHITQIYDSVVNQNKHLQQDTESSTVFSNNETPVRDNIDPDEIDELALNLPPNSLSQNESYHKIEKSGQTNLAENHTVNNNVDDDLDELTLLIIMNNEPNTLKQANTSSDRLKWLDAMQAEIDELKVKILGI